MTLLRHRLFLALIALFAILAPPLPAATITPDATFFSPEISLGTDPNGYPVYYLDHFDTFTYDPGDSSYVYKYTFGWLYYFGGSTSEPDDVYFYDFTEGDILYTSSDLYPYFYSFNLASWLYYFEGSSPREFYSFVTDGSFAY